MNSADAWRARLAAVGAVLIPLGLAVIVVVIYFEVLSFTTAFTERFQYAYYPLKLAGSCLVVLGADALVVRYRLHRVLERVIGKRRFAIAGTAIAIPLLSIVAVIVLMVILSAVETGITCTRGC